VHSYSELIDHKIAKGKRDYESDCTVREDRIAITLSYWQWVTGQPKKASLDKRSQYLRSAVLIAMLHRWPI
jgi:hypothetical protein